MRRTTYPTLLAILIASAACSSPRRIAIHDAPLRAPELTRDSLRILERIESGAFGEAGCEIDRLSDSFPRDPAVVAARDLLIEWLALRRQTLKNGETPSPEIEVEAETDTEAAPDDDDGAVGDETSVVTNSETAGPPPLPTEETPREEARCAVRSLSAQEIESLKRQGMQVYSEGKVAAALECWLEVLAAAPADEEAKKLAARAETVLLNRGSR